MITVLIDKTEINNSNEIIYFKELLIQTFKTNNITIEYNKQNKKYEFKLEKVGGLK